MKKILFGLLVVCFVSCKKQEGCTDSAAYNFNALAEKNDGSCLYYGKRSIWNNGGAHGNIDIYISGNFVGTIANYFPGVDPECESAGTLTNTMNPGTYTLYAIGTDGAEWNGNIIFNERVCTTYLLPD